MDFSLNNLGTISQSLYELIIEILVKIGLAVILNLMIQSGHNFGPDVSTVMACPKFVPDLLTIICHVRPTCILPDIYY